MKRPVARPVSPEASSSSAPRVPRVFTPEPVDSDAVLVEPLTEAAADADLVAPVPRRMGWAARLVWATAAALVSLSLGLAAERLINDLFATTPWLGWLGLGLIGLFLLGAIALFLREYLSVKRLRTLEKIRGRATLALDADRPEDGRAVLAELTQLYAARPDLARGRKAVAETGDLFDGSEMVRHAERMLMTPLDQRARALTAASARRVALVTTVSPRALIDIAFVLFESFRLGAQVARLYGARPGLLGSWRLFGAILSHLAVTGGLVLTDGVVEQLVGQGLAAKLSARLGEGIVNGLMTVRVGIAAMRVARPLPFATQPPPRVKDFIPELANVLDAARDK